MNADTRAEARSTMGHTFRPIPGASRSPGTIGDAQGVMIDPETGMRMGASDPRLGGVPAGAEGGTGHEPGEIIDPVAFSPVYCPLQTAY